MRATIGSITINVSDAYIKKFNRKEEFIKSQSKELMHLKMDESKIKEVLADMYDCLK